MPLVGALYTGPGNSLPALPREAWTPTSRARSWVVFRNLIRSSRQKFRHRQIFTFGVLCFRLMTVRTQLLFYFSNIFEYGRGFGTEAFDLLTHNLGMLPNCISQL